MVKEILVGPITLLRSRYDQTRTVTIEDKKLKGLISCYRLFYTGSRIIIFSKQKKILI